MGLIREPLDVDFVVDSRPLTKAEEKALSEFIKASKKKIAKQLARKSKSISKKRAA